MVSEAVRRVEDFLPRALKWWTDWYAANPEWFAGGIVAIAIFMSIGNSLSARIRDGMRIIWQNRPTPVPLSGTLHDAIYTFRTHPIYQFILNLGRRHVVPLLLAVLMVWYGSTVLSHFVLMLRIQWARSARVHRPSILRLWTKAFRRRRASSTRPAYVLRPVLRSERDPPTRLPLR